MNPDVRRTEWSAVEERLRPFLSRRVARDDVDDVLQEVLLRLHRGLPALRDEETFAAWAYQVARSAVADHFRTRARAPSTREDPGAPDTSVEPSVPPIEPDDGIGARELAACLAPLAARLPSPYREAITLVELEGLMQGEAARLAGVSVSGMKSRVQRGRQRLRAVLETCCAVALDARGSVLSAEPRDARSGCCREPSTAPRAAGRGG